MCLCVCGPKHPWPLTGLVCLTVGKANSVLLQKTQPQCHKDGVTGSTRSLQNHVITSTLSLSTDQHLFQWDENHHRLLIVTFSVVINTADIKINLLLPSICRFQPLKRDDVLLFCHMSLCIKYLKDTVNIYTFLAHISKI